MLRFPSSPPAVIVPFLQEALRISQDVCGDGFLSLRAFGSVLDGTYVPKSSDIDLLVVVKKSCPDEVLDRLSNELWKLEVKNNVAGVSSSGTLFAALSSRTVFFRSHFIIRESTLMANDFGKMAVELRGFDLLGGAVLRFLGKTFVPWRLVMTNVVSQSKIIAGNDSLSDLELGVPWRAEAARSFLFAISIANLGAVMSIVSPEGTRMSLEALKWYLMDLGTDLTHKRCGLSEAEEKIYKGRRDVFIDTFQQLRMSHKQSRFFSLSLPIYLTHLLILRVRNKIPLENATDR
jgi:predicted nucleotidyltransferase